jgi:tol-pal system beta propeller repeat protein TolB
MWNTSKRTNNFKRTATLLLLLVMAGCNLPAASTPTPDLFATLQASTPLTVSTPTLLETPAFTATPVVLTLSPTALPADGVPAPSPADGLTGHIVFTCQLFKVQARDQICIMNADGTDYRRLTTQDSKKHFYPSLAPDGRSVVYSAFYDTDNFEIYELRFDGEVNRITNSYGVETAPEISPDGASIAYTRFSAATANYQIIIADRNGNNAGNIPQAFGWDPTWSPDGKRILYASDRQGSVQLFTVRLDGSDRKAITSLPALRGRSDWAPDGNFLVTYSGPAWNRELYIMNADGSNVRQLTPGGGNSQGPSFSPDGNWVVFTAYFDHYGDDHGCEIYVIRTDGTDLRRLTNNDYCDYQPRWGP